jgi:uncharacterized protein DUF6519
MPNIDISRDATDLRKHYSGVHMQQGRVLTDDDFNEAERLDAEDARRVRVDVIGPAGSPDDGFRLKIGVIGGVSQVVLTAGQYYVGGLRLELEQDEPFNLQRDWLQQGSQPGETLTPPAGDRFDFVWLDVWQQPVSAVEDKELLEAALGGADTSARIRTMRRARVLTNIGDVDCAAAWTQLLNSLSAEGTIDGDFELVPDATLQIGPDGTAVTDDLCSPPVNGGYLGAENQAIRVQIVGANQFTWGFDNGAPLYRVKLLADNNGDLRRVHMLTVPKDQAHYPLEGQVVELLPWSALLQNGQKNAELAGFMAKVNGGYNPDTQDLFIDTVPPDDTGTPVMPFGQRWSLRSDNAAISNEDPPEDEYFYMRVWNRGGDTQSPPAIGFAPGTPVSLARTGLQVTFTGANLRKNDFWIIAARPETPNVFVPWELSDGRRPHGVRRWIAPLGIIHWTGPNAAPEVVDDCRPTFLPLTRLKGCCTYTVGDGTHSFGNFGRIQDAVNALPATGGKICVLTGIYNESVLIDQRVSIHIHGCGPRSRVRATSAANGLPLPAFMISNSTEITLEDLAIESGPRSAVQIHNARHVTVRHCLIQMRDLATLWQAIFSRGDDILIEGNIIEVLRLRGQSLTPTVPPALGLPGAPAGVETPPDPTTIALATRGGIQLGGGSDRVQVKDNIIRGGIWNGITLGSLHLIGSNDPNDDVPDTPTSEDPCDQDNGCNPPDLTEGDGENGNVRFVSAGDLYDIRITGNRIIDMGINGISVVRFFNLGRQGAADMVGVHGLYIADNLITRCMRRSLEQVSPAMQFLVAYGGISLTKVTDLRILRNEIVDNGANHLEPICGVFAIFVQGLQLDDNRITNNGAKTPAPASTAQVGIRGGVHIWFVLPIIEATSSDPKLAARLTIQHGIPSCSIRDNIIVVPLGRALTFLALGSVVVARNRLMTQGSTGRGLDFIAATVLIGNLGISNEWTLGLLFILVLKLIGNPDLTQERFCERAKVEGLVNNTTQLPSLWPPLSSRWATGKTLFVENQVTLDLTDVPFAFGNNSNLIGINSNLIFTLDDVGFADNQCEISSTNAFVFIDALIAGGSARVADNRLSETWRRTGLSAVSVGGMNTTTDNQSTHCMLAFALLPNMRIFRDNLSLIQAFCPDACVGRLTNAPN